MTRPSGVEQAVTRRWPGQWRGFVPHLIGYLVVNAALIVVWATTGPYDFFWPIFSLLFWGVGLVTHAWNAFVTRPIETDVVRETEGRWWRR